MGCLFSKEPSASAQEVTIAQTYPPDDPNGKRMQICKEIVGSEESYITSLKLCVQHYLEGLEAKAKSGKPLVKPKKIEVIFSNIREIVSLNEQLLPLLQQQLQLPNPAMGKAIGEFAIKFKIYTTYVNNYTASTELYADLIEKKKFQSWHMEVVENSTNGKFLNDFLIMPVQRIPRYEMLLKELLKSTPDSHPDFSTTQIALDDIKEVADYINEQKRIVEEYKKLLELQVRFINEKAIAEKGRILKKHDDIMIGQGHSNIVLRHFFLFNDMIIIAMESSSTISNLFSLFHSNSEENTKYKVEDKCKLLNCEIIDSADKHDKKNCAAIKTKSKKWIAQFEDAEKKDAFLELLYSVRARAPTSLSS